MVSLSRCLSSFLLLVLLICFCEGSIIPKMVHVRIINNIGNGSQLNFHCKSHDDDLGQHQLAPNEFWEFSFRPNFMGGTLYFCRFWWKAGDEWFDIYDYSRDGDRCTKQCWWTINQTGPCLYNSHVQRYTLCEDWNPADPPSHGVLLWLKHNKRVPDISEWERENMYALKIRWRWSDSALNFLLLYLLIPLFFWESAISFSFH